LTGPAGDAASATVVGIAGYVGFTIDSVTVAVCRTGGTIQRTAFIGLTIAVVIASVAHFQGIRADRRIGVVTVDRGAASVLGEEAVVIVIIALYTAASRVIDVAVTVIVHAVAHFFGTGVDVGVVVVAIDRFVVIVVIGIDAMFEKAEVGQLVLAHFDIIYCGENMVFFNESQAVNTGGNITERKISCWGQESGKGASDYINKNSRGIAVAALKRATDFTGLVGTVEVGIFDLGSFVVVIILVFAFGPDCG